MPRVLHTFIDSEDQGRLYPAGGTYPREGFSPSPEHLAALMGKGGAQQQPLIAPNAEAPHIPVKTEPAPKKKTKKGA